MDWELYLDRSADNSDILSYNDVYASGNSSVAALTAGLDFIDELLTKIVHETLATYYFVLEQVNSNQWLLRMAVIIQCMVKALLLILVNSVKLLNLWKMKNA